MKIEDILNALPTKEDLAQSIGLQTRQPAGGDVFAAFGIFGTGLLIGAGLALLFAPKPGTELRHEIASKVGEVSERLGATASHQVDSPREGMTHS